MSLTIELLSQEEQTEFNLRRWEEISKDAELAKWEGRVETDRHGQLIMSPPPASNHGARQARISYLLFKLMPKGIALTECPISTVDGVRAADVAWLKASREAEVEATGCFLKAPEICVEVVSPDNSRRELDEKKALYFAAGALEVWFCRKAGEMEFHLSAGGAAQAQSQLCPTFPRKI
jgi:Uma2 family endonuclease